MKMLTISKMVIVIFTLGNSFYALSHAGHGNTAPWHACENKKLNQTCTYTTHNQKATGTCQAMNNVLMCVRTQPLENIIEKATKRTKNEVTPQSSTYKLSKQATH
ncbi:hypothetical protein P4S65_16530 [Pseudoalteromonas sp. B131b]|uniref:hypothetical protein n=1 Tax=Pseudoalteromonas TaxID=53246 RepID=UPI00301E4A22